MQFRMPSACPDSAQTSTCTHAMCRNTSPSWGCVGRVPCHIDTEAAPLDEHASMQFFLTLDDSRSICSLLMSPCAPVLVEALRKLLELLGRAVHGLFVPTNEKRSMT
eukprot:365169-Chlamydomonas_euryale.AAC.13